MCHFCQKWTITNEPNLALGIDLEGNVALGMGRGGGTYLQLGGQASLRTLPKAVHRGA